MDKKIVEFYSDLGLQPHKLIEKGARKSLSRARIEEAMVHCYKKIINEGKYITDIDVARYVFNVAKDKDGEVYERDNDLLNLAKEEMHRDKRFAIILLSVIIAENYIIAGYYLIRMFYG